MPADPFDSPKALLNRARELIGELNARSKAFVDMKPYSIVREFDINAREYVHKIVLREALPGGLATVAADALNNLKSTLDQSVCASLLRIKPDASLSGACFPFGDTEAHFRASAKDTFRKFNNIAPEIVSFITDIKPYKRGNDLLYLMNIISKANRHRILQPVIIQGNDNVAVMGIYVNPGTWFPATGWDSDKQELVIVRTTNPDLKYDLHFAFEVAFGDVEVVGGKPAVPLLSAFLREVERILAGIEGRTGSILLNRG